MYPTLITSLNDGILTITINRPDKLNALNKQVLFDLNNVLKEVAENKEIRSAIITGSGEKAFVAGADISGFLDKTSSDAIYLSREGQDIFFKIENSQKPIIACVNGFALGGGCELAMSCHLRVCSENAKFGQPEINLGIIPGYGGTQRLVQLIGKARAMEMILTGNMIDAATALQYGLVNYVVPQGELIAKAEILLQTINSKSPLAVSASIVAVNAATDFAVNGYETEIQAFAKCFGTNDMREGVQAFLEKRKPAFKGN